MQWKMTCKLALYRVYRTTQHSGPDLKLCVQLIQAPVLFYIVCRLGNKKKGQGIRILYCRSLEEQNNGELNRQECG